MALICLRGALAEPFTMASLAALPSHSYAQQAASDAAISSSAPLVPLAPLVRRGQLDRAGLQRVRGRQHGADTVATI